MLLLEFVELYFSLSPRSLSGQLFHLTSLSSMCSMLFHGKVLDPSNVSILFLLIEIESFTLAQWPFLASLPQIPTYSSSLTWLSLFWFQHQLMYILSVPKFTLERLPLLPPTHLAPAQLYDLIFYQSLLHPLYSATMASFCCSSMSRPWQELFPLPQFPFLPSPVLAWIVSSWLSDPSINAFADHPV